MVPTPFLLPHMAASRHNAPKPYTVMAFDAPQWSDSQLPPSGQITMLAAGMEASMDGRTDDKPLKVRTRILQQQCTKHNDNCKQKLCPW